MKISKVSNLNFFSFPSTQLVIFVILRLRKVLYNHRYMYYIMHKSPGNTLRG